MAADDEHPLDEVVWNSPDIVQEMGFIHTNTVQPYFARSPFFDATSNNAVVMNQATYNPAMFPIIQTRAAFEEHLRSMAGLEFMVTHDPSANDTIREHNGIWVLRKQTRRKRPNQDDEITPHSAYFVVGDKIYMAPSVGGILESRMLSTVTKLTKLLATAATLPLFTPAVGHTYYVPIKRSVGGTNAKDAASTSAPSKEGTPVPDGGGGSTSNTARAAALELSQSSTGSGPGSVAGPGAAPKKNAPRDTRSLLQQTIQLTERYAAEYMDTTPLQGEPGSFVLKKAGLLGAKGGAGAGMARTASTTNVTAAGTGAGSSSTSSVLASRPNAPAVPPLQTDLADDERKRKQAQGERSASGANASAGATTPVTPSGSKKRKKSKAAGMVGAKLPTASAT